MEETPTPPQPHNRLIPVTKWNEHHQWPPIGGLRHLIFFAKENGFEKVIRRCGQPASDNAPSQTLSLRLLFITACGTSVDSMAVGASLALMEVNIWLMAALIALTTFTMSTLGIMVGHVIGQKAGRLAEFLGGLCLIGIGSSILIDHLGLL